MSSPRKATPFYRDTRTLALLAQVAFLVLVIAAAALLVTNLQRGLARQNLDLAFNFLSQPTSFDIAEGKERLNYFVGTSTFLDAFLVGLYNTLRVAITGIVLATILGVAAGVARLSSNWLVNRLALVYVEAIRNTPLLVQLVFWYYAVILELPQVRDAIRVGPMFLSQRGAAVPWPVPTDRWAAFVPWLLAAVVAAGVAWIVLARRRARAGVARPAGVIALAAFAVLAALGFLVAGGPLEWSTPRLGNFGVTGGAVLTPEFTALLAGLVVYTGAFIAEIVRAGILAVPHGQSEAARALGLSPWLTLRLVVLPQALRVIVPPLGNQYLNLTKNSSLAVYIGYPDLFNVASTAGNQSGNNVQALLIVLVVYLVLSLLTAAAMNVVNRGARFRTR